MSTSPRVVSLVPSVTETLIAWGLTPAGCTRFCEQPDLVHVGGTKDPDIEAIVAIAPDLVIVDEEENRREDADALAAAGIPVHATAVRSVADVGPALGALAERLGVGADMPAPVEAVPRPLVLAFVPIWRRPWMTINGDTYGSSLLAAVGIGNVYADEAERYPTITLADVADRAPGVALLPSEPYPFGGRHVAEVRGALGCDVRVVDGRDLFWWGARTPAAVGRLAASIGDLRGP